MMFRRGLQGQALIRSHSKPSSSHCARHRFFLTFTGHQRDRSQSQSPLVKSWKNPKYLLFISPLIPFHHLLVMTSSCLCSNTHSLKEQEPPRPKGGLSLWQESTAHP